MHHSPLRRVALVLCISSALACTGPQHPDPPPDDSATEPGCAARLASLDGLWSSIQGDLERTAIASDPAMQEARSSLGATWEPHRQRLEPLCEQQATGQLDEAAWSRHLTCLDQATLALGAIDQTLANLGTDPDPRHAAWLIDNKTAWLAGLATCHDNAAGRPETFVVHQLEDVGRDSAAGCVTTRDGYLDGGTFRLASAAGEPLTTCQPLTVQAELRCQRKHDDGSFEPVQTCNGSSLRVGDRFKLSFRADRPAHLYVFLSNSSGQFQTFFPDVDIPNRAEANVQYDLPPGDGWFELDDVSGVIEQLQIAASTAPIVELEALRGLDLPPASPGQAAPLARATRGRIEPLATRGKRIEPLATRGGRIEPLATRGKRIEPLATRGGRIEPLATRGKRIEPLATRGAVYSGGTVVLTQKAVDAPADFASVIVASGMDVVAVEFVIRHLP